MAVRIGIVNYLNTLPLVHGLSVWRDAECHAAVPSKLAGMLTGDAAMGVGGRRGTAPTIDIGLVSIIDAARSDVPLTLIPAGMIGCDGPTLTVRLFSAVPLDRVRTIHADTDSHTSVALCRVVLEKRYGLKPRVVDFDARERMALGTSSEAREAEGSEWPETLLMIGDKVVTASPPAMRYPHQLDLGEAWKALTGLPFVYAMWMCRSADADSNAISTAAVMLDRQRRRNAPRLDWIVDRYATERGWPTDLSRAYLGGYLRYAVGSREREAVGAFFEACADLGIAPRVSPRWLEVPEGRADGVAETESAALAAVEAIAANGTTNTAGAHG